MAQIVKGTIIAVVPIAVPKSALVKGNKNTTSKMNGMERPTSITRFKMKFMALDGNKPPGRVSLTSVPIGRAISQEINKETKDMYKVSIVASNIPLTSYKKKPTEVG